MQGDAGIHGEGLEPLLHQLGVEGADLVAHELGVEHQIRPAGYVDGNAGQRLVHRHVHVGVAGDALHVAERLLHRLAERDADVLGRVVMVDVQVALGLDRDVDARMPRQEVEHVVEETDTSTYVRTALSLEIDRYLDLGFLGLAFHGAFAHGRNPSIAPPFSRGFADSPPPRRRFAFLARCAYITAFKELTVWRPPIFPPGTAPRSSPSARAARW